MILATGKHSAKAPGKAGFTLIEIVLVLGLMILAATIVITNFASMADRGDSQTSVEILQAAVRKARFIAASERTIIELSFDKENGSLQIINGNRTDDSFPLDNPFKGSGSAEIRFYLVPPGEGLSPQPDASRTGLETNTVKFAADRSSSPFVVHLDSGSSTPDRFIFDPFSSLLITPK